MRETRVASLAFAFLAKLAICSVVIADVQLPQVFSDHMVLQRDVAMPVWGKADPGEEVTVTLDGQHRKTNADKHGLWRVEFAARSASESPIEIRVEGKNTIRIRNVHVGEVWVCAGQSNMEWPLAKSAAVAEIRKATNANLRLLYLRGAARGGSGNYTRDHIARLTPERFTTGTWRLCTPDSASTFSAVAYFFGQQLHEQLGVPVGLICSAIGGTPTEAWIRREALEHDADLKQLVQGNWLENDQLGQWCRERAKSNLRRALNERDEIPGDDLGPNHSFKPGFMWQSGVKPLIPFPIRGVIWYQGESNAQTASRAKQHPALFRLLVKDWRKQWNIGDFPFYYVQLPAMGRPHWPAFREGQRLLLNELSNVGMAVTMDVGHASNVHPTQKKPVGDRLARLALSNAYGKPGVSSGPVVKRIEPRGTKLVVHFDHAESGLATSDGQPPRHFEIAGADKLFHPAEATIDSSTLIVRSPKVSNPKHARYAWVPFPKPPVNLTNAEGLPASPFVSDADSDKDPIEWGRLPDLPDKFGFGGPLAGTHNGALIVAGGANFPHGPPWPEGDRPAGKKVWHDRIFVLEPKSMQWHVADAKLPKVLAYAPCVSTSDGVFVLGGETYGKTTTEGEPTNFAIADVSRIEWNPKAKRVTVTPNALPPLPRATSYHAATLVGSAIYVAASHPRDKKSDRLDTKSFWTLDLSAEPAGRKWKNLPAWPGSARHKVALTTQSAPDDQGKVRPFIYMLSGSTWVNDADGRADLAKFQFFTDNFRFDPKHKTWKKIADLPAVAERRRVDLSGYEFDTTRRIWKSKDSADKPKYDLNRLFGRTPRPAAASTAVGVGDRTVLLMSGATGRFITMDVKDRPLFPTDVLAYDTRDNSWRVISQMPQAVVTTAVVRWKDRIIITSGEIRPGVRTRHVQTVIIDSPGF